MRPTYFQHTPSLCRQAMRSSSVGNRYLLIITFKYCMGHILEALFNPPQYKFISKNSIVNVSFENRIRPPYTKPKKWSIICPTNYYVKIPKHLFFKPHNTNSFFLLSKAFMRPNILPTYSLALPTGRALVISWK